MNAHCHRLVFDRRTRTLVPVAEFTAGAKKGNRSGPGARMNGAAPHGDTLRTAIVLALALFASGASWHACAQMAVAPSTGATPPQACGSDLTNQAAGS